MTLQGRRNNKTEMSVNLGHLVLDIIFYASACLNPEFIVIIILYYFRSLLNEFLCMV